MSAEAQVKSKSRNHAVDFVRPLSEADPELAAAIAGEMSRQDLEIELIASENIVSQAVLEAQGSGLTNKYAEGYPGMRYYGGCHWVDIAERLAIERAKRLFSAGFANVQPHSGSQANQAAFMALMQPGDVFLGMSLAEGGHLTHGSPVNQSGKWFTARHYGVRREDCRIDYEDVRARARAERPKLIIAGGSGYSRIIDFAAFRDIADEIGAYLMVDMAHFAGLVAAGLYPNPLAHAHVVTTTTHKTLRGPRGGLVLTNDPALAKKINSAVFPGLQGGPLMHVIAAKAVALGEALRPEFRDYAEAVIDNCRVMAEEIARAGLDIVSGGTDTHLALVDLRPKGVTGVAVQDALGRALITCNKNGIPFDDAKPSVTSGIRIGSAASTSRGFGEPEFRQIGRWIAAIVESCAESAAGSSADGRGDAGAGTAAGQVEARIRDEVTALTRRFPVYRPD